MGKDMLFLWKPKAATRAMAAGHDGLSRPSEDGGTMQPLTG